AGKKQGKEGRQQQGCRRSAARGGRTRSAGRFPARERILPHRRLYCPIPAKDSIPPPPGGRRDPEAGPTPVRKCVPYGTSIPQFSPPPTPSPTDTIQIDGSLSKAYCFDRLARHIFVLG